MLHASTQPVMLRQPSARIATLPIQITSAKVAFHGTKIDQPADKGSRDDDQARKEHREVHLKSGNQRPSKPLNHAHDRIQRIDRPPGFGTVADGIENGRQTSTAE